MKQLAWGKNKPGSVRGIALGVCAALLLLFAILSYSAARGKSATYDEPLHSVAGWIHRTTGDFRINAEDPALFGFWGSLVHGGSALKINKDLRYWDDMLKDFSNNQWPFVVLTLYRTPGNDGDAFLQQSRFMFVIVGVALGALIAWWAWQIAGPVAAVAATALFALDPNFLAHSGLVKNDVMLSFMFASVALALWRFGRRGTWLSLTALALACAAGVNVKFSGILAGPVIFLALLVRALLPKPWNVVGKTLGLWWQRLIVVPAVCIVVGIVTYLGIWACYGFRYAPTHDGATLDIDHLVTLTRINKVKASLKPDEQITNEEYEKRFNDQKPGPVTDTLVWAMSHHVLPQAWLYGFGYTYATTLIRSSFLLGQIKATGWWYYFPCCLLFKTPTATLAAIPILIVATILSAIARYTLRAKPSATPVGNQPSSAQTDIGPWWLATCLALPVVIYATSAMTANLNLGLRHILPIYPFLFIVLGIGIAAVARMQAIAGAVVGCVIVLGVAVESLAAYPDYLPFFNLPSGGSREGIKLLGDSNLDWGQDLKLLASWRKQHADKPMYLAYFGVAEPKFYGVDAVDMPPGYGGWVFSSLVGEDALVPQPPCYLAVSATNLQGIYIHPAVAPLYRELQSHEPIVILGGSMYVYALPFTTRGGVSPPR